MVARTPAQARKAFLAPVRRALSCVTDAVVPHRPVVAAAGAHPRIEAFALSRPRLRLPLDRSGGPAGGGLAGRAGPGVGLLLRVAQEYQVTEVATAQPADVEAGDVETVTAPPPAGGWARFAVVPRAYRFRLQGADERERVSWHWHPYGRSSEHRPHLHVAYEPVAGAHLPTGPVSLVDVLRVALVDLGTRPHWEDWQVVLDEAEAALLPVPALRPSR